MNRFSVFLSVAFLAACGSGGGGSNIIPTPTPAASTNYVALTASASSVYESSNDTITLTATLSRATTGTVVVALGTTGTATEGTDYNSISNITIAAGSTTGITGFVPLSDIAYEDGTESATIYINSVSGGSAQELGFQSVIITINEYALNSGTTRTYDASVASAWAENIEFDNFNGKDAASVQNPFEVINLHKAFGYGLSGSGQQIAILDTEFATDHSQMSDKTIASYGTLVTASNSGYHGSTVSSIAAGDYDGGITVGVAYNADLHFSDVSQKGDETYFPTHWANATDHASAAIVQNNSWGPTAAQINTVQNYAASNSVSNASALATYFTNGGSTSSTSSIEAYVDSLNNFQNHGVVVFAISNTSALTDADAIAGLPEFFPELEEAWITAINIEVLGALGSETYTLKSAPCGQTKEYCLGGDGWQIKGAAYTGYYMTTGSGTSFVAPQISGAIALLAEAFPNHTPEQLTDRLLASADNDFFEHTGATTFVNGVEHGYSETYGHGIMDIYAALQPITNSLYSRSLKIGENVGTSTSHTLEQTYITTDPSLGDALETGLMGVHGYFFDSMNGEFAYAFSQHIRQRIDLIPVVNLHKTLGSLGSGLNIHQTIDVNFFGGRLHDQALEIGGHSITATYGAPATPLQSFMGSFNALSTDESMYLAPFLNDRNYGVGLSGSYELDKSRVLYGFTIPLNNDHYINDDHYINGFYDNTARAKKSYAISYEADINEHDKFSVLFGSSIERGSMLNTIGHAALSFDGITSNTSYVAINGEKTIGNTASMRGVATISRTDAAGSASTLVNNISPATSTSFGVILNKAKLLNDNDYVTLSLVQPSRVNSGNLIINIPNRSSFDGTISYDETSIDLEPSGRQLNMSMEYGHRVSKKFTLGIKAAYISEYGHRKNSHNGHSVALLGVFKNFRFGAKFDQNIYFRDSLLSGLVTYTTRF